MAFRDGLTSVQAGVASVAAGSLWEVISSGATFFAGAAVAAVAALLVVFLLRNGALAKPS